MPTGFKDFHLSISRFQDGYRARVTESPAGEASNAFTLPFGADVIQRLSLRAGFSPRDVKFLKIPDAVTPLSLEEFGAQIFDAVFAGQVGKLFVRSLDAAEREQQTLRLRMQFDDAPEAADLPWEYLYSRELDRFLVLSTRTAFVRYLALAQVDTGTAVRVPVRVLVVVSNPSDLPHLEVEEEWERLNEAVADLVSQKVLVINRLKQATLAALRKHLLSHEVHIFHFIGHGEYDSVKNEGSLAFENVAGNHVMVTAKQLATVLHDHSSLRLVFLNACHGAATGSSAFAGVAQRLVQQGVPAVLAMQFAISDRAAIALAHEFYQALAAGLRLEQATAEARKAIYSEGMDFEWGTPVLFSRSRSGVIVAVAEQASEDARKAQQQVSQSPKDGSDTYLSQAIQTYEANLRALRQSPTPDQPYRFLLSYTLAEHTLFFGRDTAVERLFQKVKAGRLTVLHAPSGAGKSSLLQAGLMPRLLDDGRLPVYARLTSETTDPVAAIKKALIPAALGRWPELLEGLTLAEYLGWTTKHLQRHLQEIVIILDQFEAFFIFGPTGDYIKPFLNDFADCIDNPTLPVRFVIALRGDYFTNLAKFEFRLPEIFGNQFRPEALNRNEAKAIITEPVLRLSPQVTYQEEVIERLLDDLGLSEECLPQLQIACTQLYEDRQQNRISLTDYENLNGVEGILGRYLNLTMKNFGEDREIAKKVLVALITSEGTKRVLTEDSIANQVNVDQVQLRLLLGRLVNCRLIQRTEDGGSFTFEIAHESIVSEIRFWVDPGELAAKQAREVLDHEVANSRISQTLIPRERLDYLYSYRMNFVGANEETLHCLLSSAFAIDHHVDEWAELDKEIAENVCVGTLQISWPANVHSGLRFLGQRWNMPFLGMVGSDHGLTRREVMIALGESGDKRAIEPLIGGLNDPDPVVRMTAAEALGRLGDTRIIKPLVATLADSDPDVRAKISQVIIAVGEPAPQLLITSLTNPNPDIRVSVAEVLANLGDTRSIEPLIDSLTDPVPSVRLAAAEALGRLRSSVYAFEPLTALLTDPDPTVRLAVAWVLVEVGEPAVEPLIATLADPDLIVRAAVAEALGDIGDVRAVEPLIAALSAMDPIVHASVARALGSLGDARAVKPLIAALSTPVPDVREAVAEALGSLGDARAVKPLIAALSTSVSDVRVAVARALGRIGNARAVKPLVAALDDREPAVGWAAVEALVAIGEPAIAPLIAALSTSVSAVRVAAAWALGRIGNARAVKPLIAALSTPVPDVREAVAEALGSLGDARAVKPLIAALSTSVSDVRVAVARALGRIGNARAVKPLVAALDDREPAVGWAAVEALVAIGEPAIAPLIAALSTSMPAVRVAAVEVLGRLGDLRAIESLRTLLDDDDMLVRITATVAIEQLEKS